ncbi:MAG: methyltransferase domain-containing protein [Bacteroidia bacterium]|nr:methyltransferase domain-containing protein [Bacteroidia bacterium]
MNTPVYSKDIFYFKQFAIKQDKCPLRVGTDAVLLGSWSNFNGAERILDIGCGTGVISLMLAQRHSAFIKGVDINPIVLEQAQENYSNSPWGERLRSRHISVQELSLTGQKFDGIACNPPFFTGCLHSSQKDKAIARHSDLVLPLDELFLSVNNLLSCQGKFSLILPSELFERAVKEGRKNDLYLTRLTWVKTLVCKPAKRILMEFSKEESPLVEDEISIQQISPGQFSPEYQKLIGNYFLDKEERVALVEGKKPCPQSLNPSQSAQTTVS